MLAEALEFLSKNESEKFKPIEIVTGDIATKTVVINGQIVNLPLAAKPRDHKLLSLDDLVAMINDIDGDDKLSAVFFNENAVTSVLDYNDYRLSRATFALQKSDQWQTVLGLKAWLDHKAFIRLLRIDLRGCYNVTELLDPIRSVKLENGSVISSDVGRQKESLGRSIVGQVLTEKAIPEEVALELPIYKSHGEDQVYVIRCSVEVDPMRTDAFRLLPMPDEIDRAQHRAMDSLRKRLVAGLPDVPVFYGCP
jgi:hypothetical protein